MEVKYRKYSKSAIQTESNIGTGVPRQEECHKCAINHICDTMWLVLLAEQPVLHFELLAASAGM